jgi:uncharacterized lipoprotein YmbA
MIRHFLLLSFIFTLLACQSSPQKNVFLLTPLAPVSSEQSQEINTLLGLGPVVLPEYLERSNIVRMGTDNQLNLNSNDFWGEKLENGIVRVLSLNLTQQNPARMIQPFPWRSDRIPPLSFRIYIHDFIYSEKQARINATWELVSTSNNQAIQRRHFIRSKEANKNGHAIAHAYSQLLAELSEEMNVALTTMNGRK